MNEPVSLSVNTDEFKRVLNLWLLNSTQELSKAINRRMFYLLVRAYVLTPPRNPDEERRKIRAYMNVEPGPRRFDKATGKLVGRKSGRVLRRVHLIAQAKNAAAGNKGLYGDDMRKAASKVFRRAVGSVGYMKAAVVAAIKKMNGHFTQWGGRTRKSNGRDVSPNGALVRIAGQYGVTMAAGNVAVMKGAKASVTAASPGLSPVAQAVMTLGTTRPVDEIAARMNPAMAQAIRDELEEMKAHIQDVVDDCANRAVATSPNGKPD